MKQTPFDRILLKLSGEILAGQKGFGTNPEIADKLALQIKTIADTGVQIGIVIGGGNIFRGMAVAEQGMDRVTGDYIGMTATIMNSVAIQSALDKIGCDTRVMSALSITQLAEPYIRRRAVRHLEKNRIVIFAGGTGNPYFTTDTAAVLRAIEINADIVLKGTKVDGIYSSDPVKNPDALKYDKLTYKQVIEQELRVMDMTAITMCKENNLPVVVFNIKDDKNLFRLISGHKIGTVVS